MLLTFMLLFLLIITIIIAVVVLPVETPGTIGVVMRYSESFQVEQSLNTESFACDVTRQVAEEKHTIWQKRSSAASTYR